MKHYLKPFLSGLAVLMLFGTSNRALAVDDVFSGPPAIVHLMVDTSGSMQYDVNPSAAEVGDYDLAALPTCSPVPDTSGRSRYTVVTEILVGSLSNYTCAYEERKTQGNSSSDCPDCGEPIPMVVPYGTRANDGLIDRAGGSFKFGVATMDSDPHHGGGPHGDWSYGPEKKPDFGAQNKHAKYGKLVVPSASDAATDIEAANQAVKNSLLTARPWGQTPIGAFLYDMEYMYQTEATFNADPYSECRKKHIVLFTDGRQNLDSSNWDVDDDGNNGGGNGNGNGGGNGGGNPHPADPYPDPVTAAQRLRSLGFEIWVVAFDVAPGITSDAQNIATNNGTLPDDHFFPIANIESLNLALFQIFNQMGCITQSRTQTVFTNNTGNTVDVQYQFNSGYANVEDLVEDDSVPGFRRGILERSVYQCGVDPTTPGRSALAKIQSISDKLVATPDGSRNIYTMVDGDLQAFVSTNNAITNSMLDSPSGNGTVLDFGRDPDTGWCKTGTLSGSKAEKLAQWRTNLFNYIRATPDSCRDGYKMGAIYHSTPALQDNLEDVDLAIPSFAEYKQQIQDRPFMLYVATHDGQMHAFRTDRPDGDTEPDYWGTELWSYIPNHVLGTLHKLPEGKETALDGAPVVADLVMSRTATSRLTEDETDWKSVLLFGDRDGGRGYTALDVTDPTNGEWSVMWEISATGGRCAGGASACNPGGSASYANNFSRLGLSYGRPAVGTIMMCPSASGSCNQNQLEEVAVAVIPGGSSDGIAGLNVGKTVFVVRLDTGAKIAEFASGDVDGDFADVQSACNSITNTVAADMIGSVTCVSTLPGTFLTRCWLGDAAGRLWRIELGSRSRADWKMSLLYDPYDFLGSVIGVGSSLRAPAYEAPAVSYTKNSTDPVIVYGSGDMDHLTDTSRKAFMVSLTDSLVPARPANCLPWLDNTCWRSVSGGLLSGPKLNWKFFFGYDSALSLLPDEAAGGRLMGPPVIYAGTTYFTEFMPSVVDNCVPGTGRLYGVDYVLNEGACDVPTPRLPTVDNPYIYEAWQPIGDSETGAVPYGVVVITRPTCIGGESIYDAGAGSAGGSPLGGGGSTGSLLLVQTGLDTGEVGETPEGGGERTIQQVLRTMAQSIESILVGTWGAVFD